MTPDIAKLGRSFVFSQSRVQVSASLPNISSLADSAFDSVHRSLSIVRLVKPFTKIYILKSVSSSDYSKPVVTLHYCKSYKNYPFHRLNNP